MNDLAIGRGKGGLCHLVTLRYFGLCSRSWDETWRPSEIEEAK